MINFFRIETELLDKVNKYFQLLIYFKNISEFFLEFLVKYIQNEFKKENERRNWRSEIRNYVENLVVISEDIWVDSWS